MRVNRKLFLYDYFLNHTTADYTAVFWLAEPETSRCQSQQRIYLLRTLHRSPAVPAGQMHRIVLTDSWHWPPLSQGFGTQDTSSDNTQKYSS